MSVIVVKLGLFNHARVLEKFYLAEIVTCRQKLAISRTVSRVDVSVVETGPDTLNGPPENASHSGPFRVFGRTGIHLLFGGKIHEQ